MEQATLLKTRLTNALYENQHCSSYEEAKSVAEAIVEELALHNDHNEETEIAVAIGDYFDLTQKEASNLARLVLTLDETKESGASESEEAILPGAEENDDVDFEEEEMIGEGECELCERFIRLTRHHLIPRSTWPRMKSRLFQAADALSRQDEHRAQVILGAGLDHLMPRLAESENTRALVKDVLQCTCDICSPCHATVHRAHDNMTLAQEYNTIEKLLQDETVYKFCKWASKQKTGKYTRK